MALQKPARTKLVPSRELTRIGNPEWEATKGNCRNLSPHDAVMECAYLSAEYREMWRTMSPVRIDFREIISTLRAKKIPFVLTGAYGIRIENLILVIEAATVPGAEKPLNAFETLTLAPIDRQLIAPHLMTAEEIAWLDDYHARVARTLGPLVDGETRTWLDGATRPLAQA